jgi:hypothetical protein
MSDKKVVFKCPFEWSRLFRKNCELSCPLCTSNLCKEMNIHKGDTITITVKGAKKK